MSKIIDLHQVDAFTNQIFGGNPAGVVTNADGLGDEQMLSIAREMNLSETAFVLPATGKADLKLRFFTPATEVDFCGHATVATLFQLARLELFGLGGDSKSGVRVETNIGVLDMSVAPGTNGQPQITFIAPSVKMTAYNLQGTAFAEKFGLPADAILKDSQILIDQNLNYLYIPIDSRKLGDLQFDFARIRQQFAKEKIVVFCLFATQKSALQARGLAPLVGIDEDPFTGSMQAGLVHAAKQNGLVDLSQEKIVVKQGQFIGRPGFAEVFYNDQQTAVTATAVQVFSTKMEI